MALRGGRLGKPPCLLCGKAAQHCQLCVPPGLTQAVPAVTAKPAVYGLYETHHGPVSHADIVALFTPQGRGRQGARRLGGLPHDEQAGDGAARPTHGCRECHAPQPYTVEDFPNGPTGWRCVVCGHILPLRAGQSINDADRLAVAAEDVDDQR